LPSLAATTGADHTRAGQCLVVWARVVVGVHVDNYRLAPLLPKEYAFIVDGAEGAEHTIETMPRTHARRRAVS